MDIQALYRRRLIYFSAGSTLAAFAWFGFFVGVALADVPIVFGMLLLITSAASFVLAWCAPLQADSDYANQQLLMVIAMNLLCILIHMSGLLIAAIAASREHDYSRGLILSGVSFCIHIGGVLGFIGKSPPAQGQLDLDYTMEEARKVRQFRRESRQEKIEDQRQESAMRRQNKRDERLEEAVEEHMDDQLEKGLKKMKSGGKGLVLTQLQEKK